MRFLALAAVVLAVAASGVAHASADARATLTVRSSAYGAILFDGRGRALYAFTRDRRGGPSRCYGVCARAGPVYFPGGLLGPRNGGLRAPRAEARCPARPPPARSQPRPRRPRADLRSRPERATAASPRRLHGQRGEPRAADRRGARAGAPVQRADAPAAPAAGHLRALLQHVRPLPGRHAHEAGGRLVLRRRQAFRPFATRGRKTIVGILATFALFSTLTVTVSIWATSGSRHRASVLEVAARQRTLAERYVQEVVLARAGARADPMHTGKLLAESADALLQGGVAPAVDGDDDETRRPRARGKTVRAQLAQERRLVRDLTATGTAVLAGRPATGIELTADERLSTRDPVERLRVLSSLTSNVSLNAARTIGADDDRNIARLIVIEVVLGAIGLLTSLLLALGLIAATRRQTAHLRSLVTSSTDLVLVFGEGGCRYASESVANMLGHPEDDLLGEGFARFVHEDDRASVCAVYAHGEPHEIVFRVANEFHEWRHLEVHVTDLRADRQIRGIVLNARDITERLRLEEELTRQAFHDGLTGLPNRALFRDRLDQSLARSERSQEGLAVLLLDLDGVKQG